MEASSLPASENLHNTGHSRLWTLPRRKKSTAAAVCKSKARADGDRYLTSRSARGLLPHYGENSLSPPSIALHDTFELGPPVRRHAEAINNDVGDLISAIEGAQAPIHSDWLSPRVAFPRPSAGPADELTDNDRRIRIGTASGHPEAGAAVAVFDKPLTIGEHDVILEEL